MKRLDKTIDYYDHNAQAFYERTIKVDVTDGYEKVLRCLPEKAHILDAGCGVGRDTKYFLSKGHSVSAFDASEKMVELAIKETGANITHSTFQELNFENMFDGVWAQASLLDIPYNTTQEIDQNIHRALVPNGIFYASYTVVLDAHRPYPYVG
ncbi:MAG: class I SAM-dependent methyltransferase [Alphaproteobacteria bacterium]|nr:class I SAM-dependent methyltransferase [Alphaproteobacteria bacterium]